MTPMMRFKDELDKLYYNPSSPGAFGSAQRLYHVAKNSIPGLTFNDVNDYLQKQITYVIHKTAKRKILRNRMIANHPNEHWQSDLVDMSAYSKSNDGYNFIVTTIDIFTKKAIVVPVKR